MKHNNVNIIVSLFIIIENLKLQGDHTKSQLNRFFEYLKTEMMHDNVQKRFFESFTTTLFKQSSF